MLFAYKYRLQYLQLLWLELDLCWDLLLWLDHPELFLFLVQIWM